MTIDGETTSTSLPQNLSRTSFRTLVIGGPSESSICGIPVKESFRGCMADVALNGR